MSGVMDADNLVDELAGLADDLRGELHPAFGVRAFRVFRLVRTWSGSERGEGSPTDVEVEILPNPRVQYTDLRFEVLPVGRDDEGFVKLSEVSLVDYKESDLDPTATKRQEVFYILRDASPDGDRLRPRFYKLAAPPFPDREKTIGWILKLRAVAGDC